LPASSSAAADFFARDGFFAAGFLAAAFFGAATAGPAAAQSNLRVGLAEDPDILDPSMARTYVGRIVFASICDKLFDIDDKPNIVPQLALSHDVSADGKEVTIKLRPGVKFQDGEAFDAEAAKFSLDRHVNFPGSFRKPELAARAGPPSGVVGRAFGFLWREGPGPF